MIMRKFCTFLLLTSVQIHIINCRQFYCTHKKIVHLVLLSIFILIITYSKNKAGWNKCDKKIFYNSAHNYSLYSLLLKIEVQKIQEIISDFLALNEWIHISGVDQVVCCFLNPLFQDNYFWSQRGKFRWCLIFHNPSLINAACNLSWEFCVVRNWFSQLSYMRLYVLMWLRDSAGGRTRTFNWLSRIQLCFPLFVCCDRVTVSRTRSSNF